MGIHEGHRKRLRERFVSHGLEGFHDINALELLLTYAIPRKDTNEIAHRLLEQFGSLQGVFHASYQELQEVDGIGEQAATLLMLLPQIVKKAAVSQAENIRICDSDVKLRAYLEPHFLDEQDEVLYLLCMDSRRAVIHCCELSRGVVNGVELSIRKLVEEALRRKAAIVAIAHNHPNGHLCFSIEDETMTKRIEEALYAVGIHFWDHLLFADGRCRSYRDSLHV